MNPQPQRILCLWFPDWPIQRLITSTPKLRRHLLLLVEIGSRGQHVTLCNRLARKRGVALGMPVAEARSFAGATDHIVIEPVQREQDRHALENIALASEAFSPWIGLEENATPECLLMDVTGIGHCFGGEERLADRLDRELSAQKFETRIAIGDSLGLAWAAAHCLAYTRQPVVVPTGRYETLTEFPIEALRLKEATVRKLRRLGITAIRQLVELDRAALVARFGNEILLRLDQFFGLRSEAITPCRPTPRFHIQHDLDDGISHPLAFEQLWSSSLQQLVGTLERRSLGTGHLRCKMLLQDKTTHEVTVRFCEAVADVQHIAELLRLKLENFRIVAPLVGLDMEALDVSPLRRSQKEMFNGTSDGARHFSMLLNRLSTRLGETSVTYAQLCSDPVPERSIQFVPVTKKAETLQGGPRAILPFDRPTSLFPRPRPVEVFAAFPDGPPEAILWNGSRFDVANHWGPERIESGWWQGRCVCRDYYRIETTLGQRLWVFRQHQERRWFWHGEVL